MKQTFSTREAIRLKPSEKEALKVMAAADGIDKSEFIRRFIRAEATRRGLRIEENTPSGGIVSE